MNKGLLSGRKINKKMTIPLLLLFAQMCVIVTVVCSLVVTDRFVIQRKAKACQKENIKSVIL